MTVTVAGRPARIIDGLPARGWSFNHKGYVIYTSRRVHGLLLKRGKKAHIAAIEALTGEPFPIGKHVHHMDFDKANNCPCNLVLMDPAFNPAPVKQCPYTGRMMNIETYNERYGVRRAA